MPSTLKTLDPTQVELEISITPEEYDAAQDAAFRKLARNAKIPGFRPGKVPRKIFESTYGSATILERALDDLLNAKYPAALEEHGIEPLTRPNVELVATEEGQPPIFKAVVAVRPEFEPKDYVGIEISDVPETASDDELDRTLEQMRRDAATLVPVDRPAQLGDTVTMDYAGTVDGVAFDGGTASGQETELQEGRFIPGFVAGIVGMRAGETKEVAVTFPDPYASADLAGKDAVFTITVHEVKEPELPELDDELAKRISPKTETVDALKAEVKRRLDETVKRNARRRLTGEVIDTLLATNDFPLPAVLVERETDALLDESRQYVARAGLTWGDYLTQSGKSEAELREGFRPEAERRVKTTLLVEAIAKKESIQATQADVEAELAALSAQYGQPRERIVEALQSNVAALIDGIVRTKTMDRLIEQAKRVPATEVAAE
ncbi:MAG: trigger factor [Candidatus Eremiobacteraeota bacterium]|nr:trigger factor [Candidatus Eremiobacteraeota bacterium]MBV8645272.1 trigger factor [Candidatus Eremiobacteraeota bacterium]